MNFGYVKPMNHSPWQKAMKFGVLRLTIPAPDFIVLDRIWRLGSSSGVTIFTTTQQLKWGDLDIPLFGLATDVAGLKLPRPASFSLVEDTRNLWFVAGYQEPAQLHPQARPGKFQKDLWKHDVAELFLADPGSGRYLEFNLSPNGAWWSCEFTAPRIRSDEGEIAMPEVATFSEMAADGAWLAAMAIPLDLLKARIDFGTQSLANVAMILNSPAQRFLSAGDLGQGEPDFHQPARFAEISRMPLPDLGGSPLG